jgi:hypothetical protein
MSGLTPAMNMFRGAAFSVSSPASSMTLTGNCSIEGFSHVVFLLGTELVAQYGRSPTEEQKAEFRVIWMNRAVHGTLSF